MNKKSLILLSGGLDSVVSLAVGIDEYNIELALTFDYGQRAVYRELEAAKKVALHYNIKHEVIKLDWLASITKTSLVNRESLTPEPTKEELDDYKASTQTAKSVWVPNRNGVFLNIAAGYCDSYDFTNIIFGANLEEGTTFPDNTQDFIDKINESLEFSTLVKPRVVAPLIAYDKTEIIKTAQRHDVPFELIRSCYHDNEKHCGKCESCMRLKRALENANLNDIIKIIFG